MVKTIDCPKCGENGITINDNMYYMTEFSLNSSSGFPNRVTCEKCGKTLRYRMVKKSQYTEKSKIGDVK